MNNMQLSLQVILALLLGIYLFAESVAAIIGMSRKDGSLHVSKYLFTAMVGAWMCVNALIGELDWLVIAQGVALASFIARRMLWRLGEQATDNKVVRGRRG